MTFDHPLFEKIWKPFLNYNYVCGKVKNVLELSLDKLDQSFPS